MTEDNSTSTLSTRPPAARLIWLLAMLAMLGGCVSQTVRVVDMTPPEQLGRVQNEDELLDIGIAVFDPNVPESYDEQIELLIQPEIRRAEANYMPYFAKNLLQSTGNWGAVRVVPRATHAVDVSVTGRIVHSDGESMEVEMSVADATGTLWFTNTYEALASKYAYGEGIPPDVDPFQTVYRNLADDMLAYRRNLSAEDIKVIRTTAEMKFAQDFAPDAFADHIAEDDQGEFFLRRLPAEDDPMLGPLAAMVNRVPRTLLLYFAWANGRIRPCDPVVSPVRGSLADLPPILVQASEAEILIDDARRYVNKARHEGTPAELETWHGMIHVWQAFAGHLPEADEAYDRISAFIERSWPEPESTQADAA